MDESNPRATIQVTVTEIYDPATPGIFKPEQGNRYVAVELRIDTIDGTYADSPSNGATLVDDQGRSFTGSFGDVKEGVDLGSPHIPAGDFRTGVIVFEVKQDAKLTQFQFIPDSGFGD